MAETQRPANPEPGADPLGEFWEMIKDSVPIAAHRYQSAPKADLR